MKSIYPNHLSDRSFRSIICTSRHSLIIKDPTHRGGITKQGHVILLGTSWRHQEQFTLIQRLFISSACYFHSPRKGHITILGDHQAIFCTSGANTNRNEEKGGHHPFRGKQFASCQEGSYIVACVHQNLQEDHITWPRKSQHHPSTIEEVKRRSSSKEGRFPCIGESPGTNNTFWKL